LASGGLDARQAARQAVSLQGGPFRRAAGGFDARQRFSPRSNAKPIGTTLVEGKLWIESIELTLVPDGTQRHAAAASVRAESLAAGWVGPGGAIVLSETEYYLRSVSSAVSYC
jgi:hypothetical protein